MRAVELLAAIGWKTIPRIDLGPLSVSPHGIGIAVGYALGGQLLAKRAERLYGIAREHIWNMLMWAVLGVIVGSRLFYVVGHIGDYIPDRPLDIIMIQKGGIVLYGGIFGGILAAWPYARKHGIPFLKTLDAAAPAFPLGLIFGRIGDLMIGDHLGGPTNFFLGWRYEGGIGCNVFRDCLPDRILPVGTVVHQTALYDLFIVLLLFPLVLAMGRRRRPDGWLISFAAVCYAVGRFFTDFARTADSTGEAPPGFFGLHGTQWVSLALVLVAGTLLIRKARAPVGAEEVFAPVGASDDVEGAPGDVAVAPGDAAGAPLEEPALAEPSREPTAAEPGAAEPGAEVPAMEPLPREQSAEEPVAPEPFALSRSLRDPMAEQPAPDVPSMEPLAEEPGTEERVPAEPAAPERFTWEAAASDPFEEPVAAERAEMIEPLEPMAPLPSEPFASEPPEVVEPVPSEVIEPVAPEPAPREFFASDATRSEPLVQDEPDTHVPPIPYQSHPVGDDTPGDADEPEPRKEPPPPPATM